jgi:hypothetical protein
MIRYERNNRKGAMKSILLGLIVMAGLGLGGVLLAADPPVLDTEQRQHKSCDTMTPDHCLRCHKIGLGEAPVAPAHCVSQSDCMSCHL